MDRRQIISEISKHTDIRKDVVEDVLKGLVDVAVEEIVNTGEFGIKDLFSISSFDWSGYKTGIDTVEPQKRLKVRLSEKIKKLWKVKNKNGYTREHINRDNWQEVAAYFMKNSENSKRKEDNSSNSSTNNSKQIESEESDNFLDFLYDEEN